MAPTQVFSSEICEIFNNNYLEEHLQWLLLNYCIAFSAAGWWETVSAYKKRIYYHGTQVQEQGVSGPS